MKLIEKINAIKEKISYEELSISKFQSEDDLYDDVVRSIILRAEAGCSTLRFQWKNHNCDNQSDWEKLKIIRENVISRLILEGITSFGSPINWPFPYYNTFAQQWQNASTASHYILACWEEKQKALIKGMQEQQISEEMRSKNEYLNCVKLYGLPPWLKNN